MEAVAAGEREPGALSALAERAAQAACGQVYAMARSDEGKPGMGATLTLLLVAGGKAAIGHVGDSRLYLLRNGDVSQLSSDHTLASELARAGVITWEEVEDHPMSHILTRSIGTQAAVAVDTLVLDVLPGDRLLLCSDGYSKYVTDPETLRGALEGPTLATIPEELVAYANEAGGRDNITVVAVELAADQPQPRRSQSVIAQYDALRSVFLFEGLGMRILARVLSACTTEEHDAGDVAIEQGALAQELMVVAAGRYALERDGESVGELLPGSAIGGTTLYQPRAAGARVVAREPSRLLRLSAAELHKLIRTRPWLGIGLLERLGRRLSDDLERSHRQRAGSDEPVGATEHF